MAELVLSAHQQDRLHWLVEQLVTGKPLIALRGLAGTGKTTLIPALRDALRAHDFAVAIGSPTHRAAMILRRKGIQEADTVHSLALMPYFRADYAKAVQWLQVPTDFGDYETVGCHWRDDDLPRPDVEDEQGRGIAWLIADRVKPDWQRAHRLKGYAAQYSAQRRLQSLGINGKDFFDDFGPKPGEGILIIDEASMVGRSLLELCQQAYPQICLVGDPGQLPPVKDEAILASVEGVELTEIHRQAQDSPIIKLAYQARQGEAFWQKRNLTKLGGEGGFGASVLEQLSTQAYDMREAPLIVWRNDTRVSCTKGIRHALGYAPELLYVGEPLVCRSTNKEDRAIGFYNNGLYRIVETDPDDPRHVVVQDALESLSTIYVHMEEYDGDEVPPRAIPFRFGYCLTAHTAQGGEWPTVYISQPEMLAYIKRCTKTGQLVERAQWTYTAITRAKETLVFLTSHTFTASQETVPMPDMIGSPIAPPSAPMLTHTPPVTAPPEEDIPEPHVPAEALKTSEVPPGTSPVFGDHEALLHGFCQALQGRLREYLMQEHAVYDRVLDRTLVALNDWAQRVSQFNEHAQYQLSGALEQLCERGLVVMNSPVKATIHAVTPGGYPIALEVVKRTSGELVEELERLLLWLKGQNYTIPETAADYS